MLRGWLGRGGNRGCLLGGWWGRLGGGRGDLFDGVLVLLFVDEVAVMVVGLCFGVGLVRLVDRVDW